jgi:hypothetical protein
VQSESTTTIEFSFRERLVQAGFEDMLIPVNLAGASTVRIRFKTPSGSTFDRTLADTLLFLTDGTDGIVRYKFASDESENGVWTCQGWVEWTGISSFYSDVRTFTFKPNIALSL